MDVHGLSILLLINVDNGQESQIMLDYGHYAIHGGEFTRSAYFTQILTEISMIQHIYNLFQEYSTLDSPDLSPGRTQLDTNRTNRTRSSGGKYESARFWGPAL